MIILQLLSILKHALLLCWLVVDCFQLYYLLFLITGCGTMVLDWYLDNIGCKSYVVLNYPSIRVVVSLDICFNKETESQPLFSKRETILVLWHSKVESLLFYFILIHYNFYCFILRYRSLIFSSAMCGQLTCQNKISLKFCMTGKRKQVNHSLEVMKRSSRFTTPSSNSFCREAPIYKHSSTA
jgi:hypothetical protein